MNPRKMNPSVLAAMALGSALGGGLMTRAFAASGPFREPEPYVPDDADKARMAKAEAKRERKAAKFRAAIMALCSTCDGTGKIDESLGGFSTNGMAACPDCVWMFASS